MFPADQIDELRSLCEGVAACEEASVTYLRLAKLALPAGTTPDRVDALLCPTPRDGYSSRLFFALLLASPFPRNWNASNVRIVDANWHAYSWKIDAPGPFRLAQLVSMHLDGLRRAS